MGGESVVVLACTGGNRLMAKGFAFVTVSIFYCPAEYDSFR